MNINATKLAGALGVRANEMEMIRRLFIAAGLIGFALLFFFSGSNALFLDALGADVLPWVYIVNAPLVIFGGLGYAAWSSRTSTATVLKASTWLLAATVILLWLWNATSEGTAAPFAAAVWYRFLFIFGLLGLWEIASAQFDVRQSKRLVPLVALGTMLAFMVGGALVGVVTSLLGTTQLLAVSGVFFALFAVSFQGAVGRTDFSEADATSPATPAQILSDPYSRNLATMRSITIVLVFVAEFIFYEQVQANFSSDEGVATFLGLFLAGATLAMIVVTAAVTGRYMVRFGVGVGLATLPGGLFAASLALIAWGTFVGDGRGFFVLAVFLNLVSMVLANAIETPVGAVMYQPMPPERRMPVRVAVDGWLGSAALLAVGLLLLAVRTAGGSNVLPFAWLLAAVGLAGTVMARRLHADYRQALDAATTLAFSGRADSSDLLADVNESAGTMQTGLLSDDPGAALAMARLVQDLDTAPLQFALPQLLAHSDDDVVELAIEAVVEQENDSLAPRLESLVLDSDRSPSIRAAALRATHRLAPMSATALASRVFDRTLTGEANELDQTAAAIRAVHEPGSKYSTEIAALASSENRPDRQVAADTIRAWPIGQSLTDPVHAALGIMLSSPDRHTTADAIKASRRHVGDGNAGQLVQLGIDPTHRRSAVTALATGRTAAIEAVEARLPELPSDYVADLVDHVYAANTRRPTLLHQFLDPTATSDVRRAGFDAVRRADIDLPATLERIVRDDVEWGRLIVATYRDSSPDLPELVETALDEEFDESQRSVWAGLRAKGYADRVAELEAVTRRSVQDDRANAIEALDAILPLKLRDLVVPMLEAGSLEEATETASELPEPLEARAALRRLRSDHRLGTYARDLLDHHLSDEKELTMSETLERVIALKRIDIFSTLPYSLLVELAASVRERTAAAGETVVEKGEQGDELFAVVSGEVELEATGAVMAAGTAFGELAVLDPGPRSATIKAKTEVQMLVVARDMLLALTDRHPEVMAEIARVLAARLRSRPLA